MNRAIQPAPVRRSVTVQASPTRAFEVFTVGFDRWWPRTHTIGAAALKIAVLEPRTGGRWYGLDVNDAEAEWGDVLVWEPPTRLVLAWRIGADWKYDPNLLTEIEVTFTAEGAATRVQLEHRNLERMGNAAEQVREAFERPGGWGGILALYAEAVAAP